MLLGATLLAGAAQARPTAAGGERFARRACAGCHAIRATGASRNPVAPPFRLLPSRLKGRRLETKLRMISAHGHRTMPPIYMTPAERRAVAAYIRSVAARRSRRG